MVENASRPPTIPTAREAMIMKWLRRRIRGAWRAMEEERLRTKSFLFGKLVSFLLLLLVLFEFDPAYPGLIKEQTARSRGDKTTVLKIAAGV